MKHRLVRLQETTSTTFFSRSQLTESKEEMPSNIETFKLKMQSKLQDRFLETGRPYITQRTSIFRDMSQDNQLTTQRSEKTISICPPESKLVASRNSLASNKRLRTDNSSKRFRAPVKPRLQSEDFNVFLAPLSRLPDPNLIRQTNNVYKKSHGAIVSFQKEIVKIIENRHHQYQNPILQLELYLSQNIQNLSMIRDYAMQLTQYKQEKTKLDENIKAIAEMCQSVKNQNFQIQSYLIVARIMQMNKSVQSAIHLYKRAKRLSDNEQNYIFKMRSYRGLGELFLPIKPKLGKLYLTKYLYASWKNQDQSEELKAYDLLGKYYFYEGNMEKAQLFHTRMMRAQVEPENSNTRKLAIIKLNNGSLGCKTRQVLMKDPDYSMYAVSSDDDVNDIVFLKDDQVEDIVKTMENRWKERMSQQRFAIRDVPKFDARQNRLKSEDEIKSANHYIRLKKTSHRSPDGEQKRIQVSKPNLNLGNIKDTVMLSHLSPNRALQNYQLIEMNKTNDRYEKQNVNSNNDVWEVKVITKQIRKYIAIIGYLMQWLNQQSSRLNKGEDLQSKLQELEKTPIIRRKGYVIS